MFSAFYVWSKVLTINNDDGTAGIPNVSEDETRRVDYSYADYDRPHNFVVNFIYQTPKVASGVLGVIVNDWQVSGIYRWTSGRPYAVNYSIPGIGAANLIGNDGNPNARIVLTRCDPGGGSSNDPYRQINTSCFGPRSRAATAPSRPASSCTRRPINNLDLSFSKAFPIGKQVRFEVRLDMFNALNHTQFTGVNATANFARAWAATRSRTCRTTRTAT